MRRILLGLAATVLILGGLTTLATPALAEDHGRDQCDSVHWDCRPGRDAHHERREQQCLPQPSCYIPVPIADYFVPHYANGYYFYRVPAYPDVSNP